MVFGFVLLPLSQRERARGEDLISLSLRERVG